MPVVVRDLPVLREVFGGAVRYASDAAALADALAAALADGPPLVAWTIPDAAPTVEPRAGPSPAGTAGTTSPAPTSRSTGASTRGTPTRGDRFRFRG